MSKKNKQFRAGTGIIILILCVSTYLGACGDDIGNTAYFGSAVPNTPEENCAGYSVNQTGGVMAQAGTDIQAGTEMLAGMEQASGTDMMDPNCEPVLVASGESREGVTMGCLEGCTQLATCAIDEGLCPNLSSCDTAGVIDACMAICSEQLLAVFSTLSGCGQTIDLAKRGLGAEFTSACEGE